MSEQAEAIESIVSVLAAQWIPLMVAIDSAAIEEHDAGGVLRVGRCEPFTLTPVPVGLEDGADLMRLIEGVDDRLASRLLTIRARSRRRLRRRCPGQSAVAQCWVLGQSNQSSRRRAGSGGKPSRGGFSQRYGCPVPG